MVNPMTKRGPLCIFSKTSTKAALTRKNAARACAADAHNANLRRMQPVQRNAGQMRVSESLVMDRVSTFFTAQRAIIIWVFASPHSMVSTSSLMRTMVP